MASAGYLPPLSDRYNQPRRATGQRTPRTNSEEANEFRSPEEGKAKEEGQKTGALGGAKRFQSLVTLVNIAVSLPLKQ